MKKFVNIAIVVAAGATIFVSGLYLTHKTAGLPGEEVPLVTEITPRTTWGPWEASRPRRSENGREEIEYKAKSNHGGLECTFFIARKDNLSPWVKSPGMVVIPERLRGGTPQASPLLVAALDSCSAYAMGK